MSDSAPSPRSAWPYAAVGLAGSVLVAYAAPRAVADPVVGWWYLPGAPSGRGHSLVLVYLGMAVLCGAWLGLGRVLPSRRALLVIAAAWMTPLALAPPLFSRDIYSYLAQGLILHLGHSPYHTAPAALAGLGHQHVLDAVSPFWRHTTAPYGPLFLGLVSVITAVVGDHLVAGVLLTRLLEVAGAALLAVYVPRLARSMGSDGRRALWLALLSPLVALELIVAGHNDLLMVGMLTAGIAYALDGRPMLGVAICALAAAVKVPALAGAAFIAVAWGREEPGRRAQIRFIGGAALLALAVLGVVTLVAGVGVDWLSTGLFSTPAKVRLAITPATGLGYTVASLLSDVGIGVSHRGLEGAFGVVGFGLTAVTGAVLLYRVRVGRVVPWLGAFLVIAAAGGPAAWPWYFLWGLALLAALRAPQRSTGLAVAICASVFVVKPNGILALPLHTAPAVVVVYLLIGAAVWQQGRRRRQREARRAPVRESTPSALAGT
ncbi:MAG TPA: polyprenol phosphomannose-dependent alpha 1,6 mannosyltransferase MptB [Solirubrobacteraceae bacterium]|nr:polyprenol phosphomannose-dependent alpha 1,6 mannosyltransferase MptB [Solirubrobacteraceae bacterium]